MLAVEPVAEIDLSPDDLDCDRCICCGAYDCRCDIKTVEDEDSVGSYRETMEWCRTCEKRVD